MCNIKILKFPFMESYIGLLGSNNIVFESS